MLLLFKVYFFILLLFSIKLPASLNSCVKCLKVQKCYISLYCSGPLIDVAVLTLKCQKCFFAKKVRALGLWVTTCPKIE